MNKFNNGDFVYLITDIDQFKRMIVATKTTLGGSVLYDVMLGNEYSVHYVEELSSEKNILI